MERTCRLVPVPVPVPVPATANESTSVDDERPAITLPDGQPLTIGRSALTAITDPLLSRQQLIITADFRTQQVCIKAIGSNPAGVNGLQLEKNQNICVKNGSIIELLLNGPYRYMVKFDPVLQPSGSSAKKKNHFETDYNIKKVRTNVAMTATDESTFKNIDGGLVYIFTKKGVKSSNKIAAYDFDGTLVKTKSGNVFPKDIDDWQLCFPEVPDKLKHYFGQGYKIVVFTNQASIGNRKLKPEDFKKKIDNVLSRIGVPAQVFISTSGGKYRKPATGMWTALCEMNNDITIKINESFYCGDAAGREKDHSFADLLFAENLNLKFQTPEQHFKGKTEPTTFNRPLFDIKAIVKHNSNDIDNIIQDQQEILMLVGFPGCGKSNFAAKLYNKFRNKYGIVSQDTLGSLPKCISTAVKLIKEKKTVIVDNTNLDIETRKKWIEVANSHRLSCRCLWFDISLKHCEHNNLYRQITNKDHAVISKMIYSRLKKKYVEPNAKEGFSAIQKMNFVPEFSDKKNETLYFQHLLENSKRQ
ncbi:polynucleotide kinase 3'-phosphatase [Arctopsyche grandis]|uniref:polynucleotide kinase 3'-phosphatase n=1 Tax=Arctopsyche grandis TaxID=121162 RepID=UPI00406D673E